MKPLKLLLLVWLTGLFITFGCSHNQTDDVRPLPEQPQTPSEPTTPVITEENLVPLPDLWATYYYMKEVEASSSGVPIRDMNNQIIGPKLDADIWCKAAIEGTVKVNGKVYNYAGTKSPKQANCSHRASSKVRWKVSPFEFGIGNRNNALIPFKTVACDQGTVRNSKRWVNGQYMKFGAKIYIPEASGTILPDGTKHNGIFICGDTGGAITGNHIDVYLGGVKGGNAGAMQLNPFKFIKSRSSGTFKAYIIKE